MSEYWEVPKRLFKADAVSANSKNVGPTVNAARPNKLRNPLSPRENATATSPVARFACHDDGKACSDAKVDLANLLPEPNDTRAKHIERSSPQADVRTRPSTYAAAAFVVGLGATSIARRCVRASSVRASCAPGLDALESRLRGCASEDIVLLIDFDRTITDGTSAQCHDVVGATECMPLRVREGFAKMLDFSQPFPPELEVGLQQLQPALTLRVS